MQSFVDKIKSFFNVRTKGMRLVLFNVMVVVAVLGGVFSIIMAIASLLPVQPVPIFIVAILIAVLPFYLANYKGRLGVASNFMVIVSCFFLFPGIFFSQGGIESGMSSWFALGILFIFLLLDGVNFVVMLSLALLQISTIGARADAAGKFFPRCGSEYLCHDGGGRSDRQGAGMDAKAAG